MEASFNRFISFDIQKGEHDAEDDRHVYKNRHHDDYEDDYEAEYIEDLSTYGLPQPPKAGVDTGGSNNVHNNLSRTFPGGEEVGSEGNLVSSLDMDQWYYQLL